MVCNLYLGDSYAMLEPFVSERVVKELTYWHRKSVRTGRGMKMSGETKQLFTMDQRVSMVTQQMADHLVTLPGFAMKIHSIMTEEGFHVNFVDNRSTLPAMDLESALSKLRDYQKPAAYTMLHSYGGILNCPTGWGKTHLMASIIRGYPHDELNARSTPQTVVVTPGTDLAEKNFLSLEDILYNDREVGLICTGHRDFCDDVQVVTPESLHHVDLSQCGLLLYDEAHTLSGARADRVMKAVHAIKCGFSATPTGRCDGADLVVEGCFGPIVYKRTYQQAVDDGAVVPITVYWVPTSRPRNWQDWKQRDTIYRHALWANPEHHQMVKEIMTEVIPHDVQTLAVVDKLSHMDNIVGVMPELTYVHGTERDKDLAKIKPKIITGVTKARRKQIYKEVESGERKRAIASGIYRTGVDFPNLTVLLNLAGMKSSIINTQLPGRTGRNIDGKESAYLIDFWHGWNRVEDPNGRVKDGPLLRDCRAREKVYRDLGFEQRSVTSLQDIRI